MLEVTQYVHIGSLDDIDTESTIGDVRLYVSKWFENLEDTFSPENLQQLTVKSDGVFGHIWHVISFPSQSEQLQGSAWKRSSLMPFVMEGPFWTKCILPF